mgnify:CR=1 FL=1
MDDLSTLWLILAAALATFWPLPAFTLLALPMLAGLRRALSRSLGIETATISTDDLNRGTCLQPCFRARNAAVVQNINDCTTLEIDHDRAVSCGATPTPIIDANDSHCILN